MNLVILAGRLGKDPEVSYTQGGTAKCKFSMATTERFSGKDGQPQEKTEWHNIIIWGKRGEHVGKYLSKGSYATVQGQLETVSWEDQKSGQTRYMTQIKANVVEFGPKSGGEGKGGGGRYDNQQRNAPPQTQNDNSAPYDDEDDIPF